MSKEGRHVPGNDLYGPASATAGAQNREKRLDKAKKAMAEIRKKKVATGDFSVGSENAKALVAKADKRVASGVQYLNKKSDVTMYDSSDHNMSGRNVDFSEHDEFLSDKSELHDSGGVADNDEETYDGDDDGVVTRVDKSMSGDRQVSGDESNRFLRRDFKASKKIRNGKMRTKYPEQKPKYKNKNRRKIGEASYEEMERIMIELKEHAVKEANFESRLEGNDEKDYQKFYNQNKLDDEKFADIIFMTGLDGLKAEDVINKESLGRNEEEREYRFKCLEKRLLNLEKFTPPEYKQAIKDIIKLLFDFYTENEKDLKEVGTHDFDKPLDKVREYVQVMLVWYARMYASESLGHEIENDEFAEEQVRLYLRDALYKSFEGTPYKIPANTDKGKKLQNELEQEIGMKISKIINDAAEITWKKLDEQEVA